MREYIRHPFEVTLQYKVGSVNNNERLLKDISEGGLCFCSPDPIVKGSKINIKIPALDPKFEIYGVVAWCRKANGYEIGVRFETETGQQTLQMVERVCHIKHYQRTAYKAGRNISTDQAAMEWSVKRAAGDSR